MTRNDNDNTLALNVRSVACPRCSASPGDPCTTASSRVMGHHHAPRWQALRRGRDVVSQADATPDHERVHPDTADGALAYLRGDCSLDLSRATARPDPQVAGVWLVDLHVPDPQVGQEVQVLVYLRGYADPWGNNREHNDFECCVHDPDYEPNELLHSLGL
jgi:hypothetical protein